MTDDGKLFEFLVLESAQAGLSWITILRKREGYRKAFCNFDAGKVARMTDDDVERLMHFDGIVKNRLKIKATITNARLFLAVQEEFGIFSRIRRHEPGHEKTGFQIFRPHDLLRPFAGLGVRQRPSDGLHLPERTMTAGHEPPFFGSLRGVGPESI